MSAVSAEIEAYLDQLAERLQAGGSRIRRLLAETEDHLRESSAALVAQGLDERTAQTEAISRYGPAELVAQRMRPTYGALARDVLRAGWVLGGLGLLAIGVSGLLAELMFQTVGARFLAGDSLGVTYTPARCADFLEYFPDAGGCASAAALHHSGEVVTYRVGAGLLGVLMLTAYHLYRRRAGSHKSVLPDVSVPLVATAVSAAAGLVLLLQAVGLWVGQAAHSEPVAGIGDPLSAGVVAILAAALAGTITAHRLANPVRGASMVRRS